MAYTIAGLAGLFIGFGGLPQGYGGLMGLASILLATSGIYMFNDVFDLDEDKVNDPTRPIPSGLVSKRQAIGAAVGMMALALILVLAVSLQAFLLATALAGVGILYSAPPFKLKELFMIPYACLGIFTALSFMIGASFGAEFGPEVVIVGILVFGYALSASMVKEFKDVEGDRKAGVRSLPVRW
jgi:4-hydroxybenzoate polyprenyltransferase